MNDDAHKRSFWERARSLRKRGWARLRGGELTPRRAGASVALGLLIGSIPVFGLHLPLCVALCVPLRLDAPVAYLAANISNPLVAPWLVFFEVQAGAWLLTGHTAPFDIDTARQVGVGGFVSYAALGTVVVGVAVTGGVLTALITSLARRVSRPGR